MEMIPYINVLLARLSNAQEQTILPVWIPKWTAEQGAYAIPVSALIAQLKNSLLEIEINASKIK